MQLRKLEKYGRRLNTHDLLKFVALVAMVIDHIGFFFVPKLKELRVIGRISFPLFAFLVGYSLNNRIKPDIVLLALASVIIGALFYDRQEPYRQLIQESILFSIILCRIVLSIANSLHCLKGPLLFLLFAVLLFCHHRVELFLTMALWVSCLQFAGTLYVKNRLTSFP